MTLKQYMKRSNLTQADLTRKISISRAMVSRLLSGQRKPSFAMAKLIQAKTKGAVKEGDWI
jgi:transcriptional regulator with XRE-family HTH domain